MDSHVFTYGSLMYDKVWEKIVLGEYERVKACLKGFERKRIRDEVYPGLVRADDGFIEGVLHLFVSEDDVERLDSFEGEMYERISSDVISSDGRIYACFLYLFRDDFHELLEDEIWLEKDFGEKEILHILEDLD